MIDQLDLFSTSSCDFEEEQKKLTLERELALQKQKAFEERERYFNEKLTSRQHRLRDYIDDNFAPGRWFTIEELCSADLGYELNTNPKSHDKCIALANDIKAINWAIADRYKIIIKDKRGACKLAESKEEFDSWWQAEHDKLETKYQYLNTLKWKEERDGTVPIVNLNDRALSPNEVKVVEVFKQ